MTDAPTIEPCPAGHRVRLRYGAGKQARFTVPVTDRDAALARAAQLRELAAELVASGVPAAHARDALETAAGAATARDFAAVVKVARVEARRLQERSKGRTVVTFGDLVEQWTDGTLHRTYPDHVKLKASADDDASRAARLNKTIGAVPLRAFTLADAERAMAALPEGYSPATRRHYAQIIAKVLKFAVYPCKLIDASPLPAGFLPKVSSKLAKAWLYPSEERRLMACRDIDLGRRLLYGFLAREGCRLSEAGGLEWSNVDLDRGTLTLDRNKTGDPRSWSMGADVTRALQAYRSRRFQRPEDARGLIFPALPSNRAADALRLDLRRAGVTRPELFERSEVRTPIRAHDLRGTFVTLALAVGRTEAWVTDRTGHSSSAMIYRYKRAARLAAELDTGWFAPLDHVIPELAPRGGESADGTPGETPSGGESEGESTEGAGVTDGDLSDRASSQKTQCRRRDSNSHEGLPRRILNPLRLPFRHFGRDPWKDGVGT